MRLTPCLALGALLVVAGCVRPAEPPPAPSPTPTPAATIPVPALPPAPPGDWRDRPYSPGDWSYARDGRGSIARFGAPGAAPELAVRCERDRRVVRILRAGRFAAGAAIRIQTSTGAIGYATASGGDANPAAMAELPARDPGLDAMMFSRGRFIVAMPGATDLVLPTWPALARVVEDCRG